MPSPRPGRNDTRLVVSRRGSWLAVASARAGFLGRPALGSDGPLRKRNPSARNVMYRCSPRAFTFTVARGRAPGDVAPRGWPTPGTRGPFPRRGMPLRQPGGARPPDNATPRAFASGRSRSKGGRASRSARSPGFKFSSGGRGGGRAFRPAPPGKAPALLC